ncbi:MAG: hypothetical protein F8N36_08510 [Desulfovibrio sp.]|uniref:hypothetical protein n=1 Tax=Desulfovibrio sp. TaxID=885 RepID=UPI00135DBFE2|nr:hypothetical protein [Desulfovibrio sp.]MTJ92887.1 hypothetical protein [Desulfovibrio sp.]
MPLKDLFTFINVRKELRFFIHRLLIGIILSFTFSADIQRITNEIEAKKLELTLILLAICIPLFVIHRFKPRNNTLKKIHSEGILICQYLTSLIRGILIFGISALIYNIIIWDSPLTAVAYILNFLLALEIITSAHFGLKDFEYSNEEIHDWITIIATNKNSNIFTTKDK